MYWSLCMLYALYLLIYPANFAERGKTRVSCKQTQQQQAAAAGGFGWSWCTGMRAPIVRCCGRGSIVSFDILVDKSHFCSAPGLFLFRSGYWNMYMCWDDYAGAIVLCPLQGFGYSLVAGYNRQEKALCARGGGLVNTQCSLVGGKRPAKATKTQYTHGCVSAADFFLSRRIRWH